MQPRDHSRRELEDRWRAQVDATHERYMRATQALTKAVSEYKVRVGAQSVSPEAPGVPLCREARRSDARQLLAVRKALREETDALRQYNRTLGTFHDLITFGRTPPGN